MKKQKMLVALLLALVMVFTFGLTACEPKQPPHECQDKCEHCGKCTTNCTDPACAEKCSCGCAELGHNYGADHKCTRCGAKDPNHSWTLQYDEGITLRIAGGYQNKNEAISFQDSSVFPKGASEVTLGNGKTYKLGDLKPTWQQLSGILGINFVDKFTGAGSAEKEFNYWKDQLGEVDIIAGSATKLQAAGAAGDLINISEYLDYMPNFNAYLEENPIVRLSVTGSVVGDTKGAIYFSPYFDGVDDIERFPLIRADFVEKLLDGTEVFKGANRSVNTSAYKPYVTEGYSVESLNAAGTAKQTITKDFAKAQNIIAQMNAKSNLKGDEAVAMFRAYIDAMYGNTYAKRSDLFLGYDAAWDADELVALLRCAVASLNDNDGNPINGMYSRETTNTQREVDLYRFAGHLFGVRGMESRKDSLFFDNEGNLHDARNEVETYQALERMNAMFKEGLIIMDGSVTSADYLAEDAGLVSYDYSQTQTVYNYTMGKDKDGKDVNLGKLEENEKYTPMMVPVAKWQDGTQGGVWMRFTESWRSVKTDGWAISKAGVTNANGTINQTKLNAALALIDYAFSIQGQITMSYGSDDFIKVKDASVVIKSWDDVSKKYYTFNFNGKEMPVVTDEMYADLQDKTGGNYTTYARRFLGSTLNGFPKSQAFEYQCTHAVGKEGAGKVSAAIALGTVKHPALAVCENMWYTSIPTTLPFSDAENTAISSYKELSKDNFGSSKGNNNIFLNIIKSGYAISEFDGKNVTDAQSAAKLVSDTWKGALFVDANQDAWDRLLTYFEGLSK